MSGRKRPSRKYHPPSEDQEDLQSLFVFGYECKLFRDDDKATYVDEERHLIPWMGDSTLRIDRYDGRGHLYALHEHDADKVKNEKLTEEEKHIEKLCDEERYLELHTDMSEKVLYEEEELKRLNQAYQECQDYSSYGAVGFNYGGHTEDSDEENQQTQERNGEDEDDEPFIVTPNLLLPEDMVPPVTQKMFAIVEKTAKFVSKQGTQMEIIIKIKQAENPQFAFLEHQDPLNPFYKHLVSLMKAGKYKPSEEQERRRIEEAQQHSYLHPKLMKLMNQAPEPELNRKDFLESVQSKLPSGQITNTVYAKLVTKMKASNSGRNSPVLNPIRPPPLPPLLDKRAPSAAAGSGYSEDVNVSPMAYPIMSAATYPEQTDTGLYGPAAPMNLPPPPGMEPVTLPSAPVASAGQPPPPGTVPPDPEPSSMYPMDQEDGEEMEEEEEEEEEREEEMEMDMLLRDYLDEEVPLGVTLPAPETQQIIDKMAAYVAKNGPDFEHIVKNKNDERFHFLEVWHVHNKYYEHRKKIYLEEMATKNVKVTITQTTQNAVGDTVVTKTTTTLANMQPGKGVSFSIKAKENEGSALASRKFLLYDSSDEEDVDGVPKKETEDSMDSRGSGENSTGEREQERGGKAEKTPVAPEELERRHAEERLKDKISTAAREKVAAASREKQLQAERKRRADMFIKMLKGSDGPPPASSSSAKSTAGSSGPGSVTSLRDENTKEAGLTSRGGSSTSSPARRSPSRSPSPAPIVPQSSTSSTTTKSPSRGTRSPSSRSDRDRDWDRHRVRDRDRDRGDRDRDRGDRDRDRGDRDRERDRDVDRRPRRTQWSPRRSRSPAWRRRTPSPRRRRHKSKTPPSAYSVVRRSKSPKKRSRSRSRSQSKVHKKKSRKSRSRSRDRTQLGGGSSRSKLSPPPPPPPPSHHPHKSKKSRKSKSRSKSPSTHKHKSKSKSDSHKTKSRSGSPSSKKSKKSKHKSHSPSKSHKSHHKSLRASPSRPSLATIEEVRTPVAARPPLPPPPPAASSAESHSTRPPLPSGDHLSAKPPLPPSTPPGASFRDDDVIIISPDKDERSPPSETTPTPGTPSNARGQQQPPQPAAPVNKDLLNKVRAMLKATRQQIIKEDGVLMD